MICLAPGDKLPCGACMPTDMVTTCTQDSDCPTGEIPSICEQSDVSDCLCEGATICKPGCMSDFECDEGESCDAAHHCVPKTCANDAACPENFVCSSGTCARKSCDGKADCVGACVNGYCFGTPGTCSYIPP
jgi:hypothetical protein